MIDCCVKHTELTELHVPSQPSMRLGLECGLCAGGVGVGKVDAIRLDHPASSWTMGLAAYCSRGWIGETAGSWTIARVQQRKQLANWWSECI